MNKTVRQKLAAVHRLIESADSPDPSPQREEQIQSLLNEVLALDPSNSDAHHDLAWSYRCTGNNPKAIEHFLKAVELSSEPSVCLQEAAHVMHVDGDPIGARDLCLRGLETIPEDHFPLHLTLTDIYLELEDYENALIHATCLSEDGTSDEGALLRARALAGLQRRDDAVAMLREVLSRTELERPAWLFLSFLLNQMGREKEAYVAVRNGAQVGDGFSDDPFEREMYLQAAALCEAHNDPLNSARYFLRAWQMAGADSSQDQALDRSLVHMLIHIPLSVNVLSELHGEFTGGEVGELARLRVRSARRVRS